MAGQDGVRSLSLNTKTSDLRLLPAPHHVVYMEDVLLLLLRVVPGHVLLHSVNINLSLVILHLFLLLLELPGREGGAPLEPHRLQSLVTQSVQHEQCLLAIASLQLAGSEINCDGQPPDVVQNVGDHAVRIIKLLRRIKLLASLPDEPGRQGGEHEELLPRVGLQHEVVPGYN